MHHPIDLALLRVFIAIYETKSVSAAAERLFVTQPTISYGLAKLRSALNDQLFTRSNIGMAPTLVAQQCYERFSHALIQIDDTVEKTRHFVPETTSRRFRIAMSDIGAMIFLPPLFTRLRQHAPNIELEVVPITAEDLPEWLASGKVDAIVGNLPAMNNLSHSTVLFPEHYVCLMSKSHSTITGPISAQSFKHSRHAFVSAQFSGHKQVEEILRKMGVLQHASLQVPHYSVLPKLISCTDLIVVLPSRVASLFETYEPLKSLPLPVKVPDFEVRVYWDNRHKTGSTQQWLISQIQAALSCL